MSVALPSLVTKTYEAYFVFDVYQRSEAGNEEWLVEKVMAMYEGAEAAARMEDGIIDGSVYNAERYRGVRCNCCSL